MIPGGEPHLQARVGTVALLVLLAAGVFVVAIWPRLGSVGGVAIDVRFGHVAALQEGAPVMQAGRTIGRVASIVLDRSDPAHPGALVRLRIARRYLDRVPVNAEVFVSSRGFLAARFLEIGPPADGAAPGRPVAPGEPPLRGVDPPTLDRTLNRTWDNLVRTRAFADAVAPEARRLRAAVVHLAATLTEVEPTPGAYAQLALRLGALAGAAGDLQDELARAGADPAQLAALAERAQATVADARAALAAIARAAGPVRADVDRLRAAVGEATVARLRAALAEGDRALAKADLVLASARALAAMIARGEGSMARLSRDPEFPEDAKELGKLLKRNPWRILGRPVDGAPPSALP